jgi:hypothetical protein
MPEKAAGWVAIHKEREPQPAARQSVLSTQKTVDSLKKVVDSLAMLVTEMKNIKAGNRDVLDADEEPSTSVASQEGSELILKNLIAKKDVSFKYVADYYLNALGQKLYWYMILKKQPLILF